MSRPSDTGSLMDDPANRASGAGIHSSEGAHFAGRPMTDDLTSHLIRSIHADD
jgi:hypothetical protein